jgi:hypothetical protein
MLGVRIGRIIFTKACPLVAPSIIAASSKDPGRSFRNPFSNQTENGIVKVVYERTNEEGEYSKPNFLIIVYSGNRRRTVGNILLLKKSIIRVFLPTKRYREKAYEARVDTKSDTRVVIDATIKLFFIALIKFTVPENNLKYAAKLKFWGKYFTGP